MQSSKRAYRIFPAEVMKFTADYHFQQHHTRSNLVYILVLLLLIFAFISLIFIQVDVSVSSQGILTASTERNTVKSPINGRVQEVFVRENLTVQSGDILLTLQSDALEGQSDHLLFKQKDLHARIADLQQLVSIHRADESILSLKTPLYSKQYSFFRQQQAELNLQLSSSENVYDRYRKLHEQRIVADSEFEEYDYAYRSAKLQLQLHHDKQMSIWQTELHDALQAMEEVGAHRVQYAEDRKQYTVEAPVSGTIQQFSGVRAGSFVTLGETIAAISPDAGLIAEVHVPPSDIGLLHEGMPVRFQVDAFNYNEWGVAMGTIAAISNDVLLSESGLPIFIVTCELADYSLTLSNGYEGKLKKGMGVQANFMVAKRTLFQLLYDKADDWLNPATRTRQRVAWQTETR